MGRWTISAYRSRRDVSDVLDVLQEWMADLEGSERAHTKAALLDMLSKMATLQDWTVFNEEKQKHPPFRPELKSPWNGKGLSRIAFNAHGKHQRMIGCFISKREYVILACGTKDKRGERANPTFYDEKCSDALIRKSIIEKEGNNRHEWKI